MLVNAVECQGYSFYRFELLKTKPTVGLIYPFPPFPIQIRVNKVASLNAFKFIKKRIKHICFSVKIF